MSRDILEIKFIAAAFLDAPPQFRIECARTYSSQLTVRNLRFGVVHAARHLKTAAARMYRRAGGGAYGTVVRNTAFGKATLDLAGKSGL
jgi:hypothetical protein